MIYLERREYQFIPGRLVQGTFRTAQVRTGGSSPAAGVITRKEPHSFAREESAAPPKTKMVEIIKGDKINPSFLDLIFAKRKRVV